jgi:hypothetical protein
MRDQESGDVLEETQQTPEESKKSKTKKEKEGKKKDQSLLIINHNINLINSTKQSQSNRVPNDIIQQYRDNVKNFKITNL